MSVVWAHYLWSDFSYFVVLLTIVHITVVLVVVVAVGFVVDKIFFNRDARFPLAQSKHIFSSSIFPTDAGQRSWAHRPPD